MKQMRTQVGIVGAGPAGLMLGHLLHLEGIDSIIVENRSKEHVIERVRAGVLEHGSVQQLVDAGVGDRLLREGMRHRSVWLCFDNRRHRVDFEALTGGRTITVYGQNEVVKDLIGARAASGRPLYFEADRVTIADVDTERPRMHGRIDGRDEAIACDFVAGCDGFHGISRASLRPADYVTFERTYPFGWLGILAQAAPSSDELVYALHSRGFALFSMRSSTVTRLYVQSAADEPLEPWTDERIWDELEARFACEDGWSPTRGPILQKGITGMRSFVLEPMRFGRLFLAGDAAHIVPPTGAKGLNLALSDVRVLARAIAAYYHAARTDLLDRYSEQCLARVWAAQRFACWMTAMLHRAPDDTAFDHRRQIAELNHVIRSPAAATSFAESYVGPALD